MFTISITIYNVSPIDGEELEDVLACALGGMGYDGHLTNSLTGNEVHFPVMDEQPLNLLSKAENRAWERFDREMEDAE